MLATSHLNGGLSHGRTGHAGPLLGGHGGAGVNTLLPKFKAYYELKEASGNAVNAVTPGTWDMTENNSIAQADGVGAGQKSRDLVVASNEYFNLDHGDGASNFIPGLGDWSICWWQRQDAGSGVDYPWELGLYTDGSNGGIRVESQENLDKFRVFCTDEDANSATKVSNVGDTMGDAFLFHIFEIDRTANTYRMFQNNSSLGWVGGDPDLSSFTSIANIGSSRRFALGSWGWASTSGIYDGRLQCVGIANALFTAAEKTYLYAAGSSARLWSEIQTYSAPLLDQEPLPVWIH